MTHIVKLKKLLVENEIQNTELALNVESMSDQLQSMVEKLSNMKTKDLAELVKKIKYDGNIEKAEAFNLSISEKLDRISNEMIEVKGELDNDIVKLFNNETPDAGADLGAEGFGEIPDFSADFQPTEEETPMDGAVPTTPEESGIGALSEMAREEK